MNKRNSENPLVLGCLSGFVFLFLLTITSFIISIFIGEDRVSEGKLDLVMFSIPFLIILLFFEYDKSVLDTIIFKANLKETALDIQFLNGMYPPAWWIPHALSGDIRMLKSPPGPDQCYVYHNNERVYFVYIKF